ncbi:MAG: phospholipase D-like domain-containing protein [Oligoflexia bacterium]|nr:phospholipase D-like domain-containing protein [Oligoflexia bacterium]
MTNRVASLGLLGAVAAMVVGAGAQAALPVEVVQSVPIETNLLVPSIRTTQEVWLEMINSAQTSIDLEEFYVYSKAGEALEPVLNALTAAAGRGVQIRLIVDSQFYKTYPDEPNALAQVPNIQVKTIDFSASDGVQHSKYFVVDGNQTFLGSANFDWLALTHIHETGLHFTDPAISNELESVFNLDWGNGVAIGSPSSSSVNAVMSKMTDGFARLFDFESDLPGFTLYASPTNDVPGGVPNTLPALLNLIASAQSSIQVQMYQYSTEVYKSSQHWTALDDALRAAAARGVHVQLMVDHASVKSGGKDLAGLARLSNVEVRVVTIPQWSGGVIPFSRLIHSKYMIVDGDQGWVGTENWSGSYFTGCRNVGLIFSDQTTVSQLGLVFNQVWTSGYTSTNYTN